MDVKQEQSKDEKTLFPELFTQYISDMTIEVEGIKIKSMRNDFQGINENLARINSAIMGIMDAILDLAEKDSSYVKLVKS